MFTKNLSDFQKNYTSIIDTKETLRFNSSNESTNKAIEEVREFVARMESNVGIKFNVDQEIGEMIGLSESSKTKYRVEKLQSSLEKIHENISVVSKNDDEENFETFEYLRQTLEKAQKIRQEALRGGDSKKFDMLASSVREMAAFVPVGIRQEAVCMNMWPGLVYRTEGIISWVIEKIKKIIDWILSLFGLKSKEKTVESSPSSSINKAVKKGGDPRYWKPIKIMVNELEKEFGKKYTLEAYDKTEVLYIKDIDDEKEDLPITKQKAKGYLNKAAKMYPVKKSDYVSDPDIVDLDNDSIEEMNKKMGIKNPANKKKVKEVTEKQAEKEKKDSPKEEPKDPSACLIKQGSPLFYIDADDKGKYFATDERSFAKFRLKDIENITHDLVFEADKFLNEIKNDSPDEVYDRQEQKIISILNKAERSSSSSAYFSTTKSDGLAAYCLHTTFHSARQIVLKHDGRSEAGSINTAPDAKQKALSHRFTKQEIENFFKQRDIFLKNFESFSETFNSKFSSKIETLKGKLSNFPELEGGPVESRYLRLLSLIGRFGMCYVAIVAFVNSIKKASWDDFH